jgi:hypothetical protein
MEGSTKERRDGTTDDGAAVAGNSQRVGEGNGPALPGVAVRVRLSAASRDLGTTVFEAEDWRAIVFLVRNLVAIEVAPYWPFGTVKMAWESTSEQVHVGVFAVALCYGMIDYFPPELE